MKFSSGESLEVPEINITPLVDIVFLLLIFFMVSSRFTDETSLKVNLPESGAGESRSQTVNTVLSINVSGEMAIGKKTISRSALISELKKVKNQPLIIKADEGVSHGRVVEALDLAKSAGISKASIATDQAR